MKNKMKRIMMAVISVLFIATIASCENTAKEEVTVTTVEEAAGESTESNNKIAFENAKKAYDNISRAYVIIDKMASDIYEAWRLSIYEGEDLTFSMLAGKLSISENDLDKGVDNYLEDTAFKYYGKSYIGTIADMDGGFSYIIGMVCEAYSANPKLLRTAQISMDTAKKLMKTMSENYSDYEHYPALKGYFTSVKSLLSWCESPDGSFEQAITTINDYRNEIRDYQQELDYIFED